MKTKTIATIASSLLLASLPTMAGSTMPSTDSGFIATTDSDWNVRAAAYGWFTAMDGETNVSNDYQPGPPSAFTGMIIKVTAEQK